jgi:hypothetical protein
MKKPAKKKFTGGAGGGIGRLEKAGLSPKGKAPKKAPKRPMRDTDYDGM